MNYVRIGTARRVPASLPSQLPLFFVLVLGYSSTRSSVPQVCRARTPGVSLPHTGSATVRTARRALFDQKNTRGGASCGPASFFPVYVLVKIARS